MDDLVQEAMLRALKSRESFRPGTNMTAWLITILRNHYFGEYRKGRNELAYKKWLSDFEPRNHYPEQYGRIEFERMKNALAALPEQQRQALLLVSVLGLPQEEAAEICHCAIGTIKSRVHRARTQLAEALDLQAIVDFGRDQEALAVIG